MTPDENGGLSVDRLIEKGLDPQRKRRVPVPIRLVAALAALIGIGTVALLLPGMTTRPITFMDALFTATSAAAVTGLAVLSTSTDFTRLGQWVILLLMQVGGLGFMVVLVLTVRLMGRRVSLMDRLAVSSSLGLASTQAILQILSRTVVFMLAVEGTGALILWGNWRLRGIVPEESAAFYALFHAVAAFCNAGFDLFYGLPLYPEGLPADPVSLLTLGALVIIGGLGIPVYIELLNRRGARTDRRRPARWSLQTRLAVWSADHPDRGGLGRAADCRIPGIPGSWRSCLWGSGCCEHGSSRSRRGRPVSLASLISPRSARPAGCCSWS